jgi:hypothetical protein
MTARASARRIARRTAPGNVSQRRSWSSREPGSSERQVTPWGCSPGDLANHPGRRQSCSSLRVDLGCLSHALLGAPRQSLGGLADGVRRANLLRSCSRALRWPVRANAGIYTKAAVAPRPSRGEERIPRGVLGENQRSARCVVEMGGGGGRRSERILRPPTHPQVRLWASWNRTSTRGTGRPEDACAMGGSFQSGFGADEPGLACGRNGERGEPPPVRRPAPDLGDFTSLPPEAVLPAPLHRRRCGFQTPARLQDLDLACVPPPASGSQCSGRIGCFACDSRRSPWAIGRSPCIPERASSEVPGAVTPRAVRFAARSSLGRSPPSRRIHANTELASDASVRGPVGGPPSSRSRRRGPGGSPSTDTRARKAP